MQLEHVDGLVGRLVIAREALLFEADVIVGDVDGRPELLALVDSELLACLRTPETSKRISSSECIISASLTGSIPTRRNSHMAAWLSSQMNGNEIL